MNFFTNISNKINKLIFTKKKRAKKKKKLVDVTNNMMQKKKQDENKIEVKLIACLIFS